MTTKSEKQKKSGNGVHCINTQKNVISNREHYDKNYGILGQPSFRQTQNGDFRQRDQHEKMADVADVRGLFATFCRGFPDSSTVGKLRPRYTVCRPHFGHCFASANLRVSRAEIQRRFAAAIYRIDPLISWGS